MIDIESWAVVNVDDAGRILAFNEKANNYFPSIVVGGNLSEVFPWFADKWLRRKNETRVIKTTANNKLLMEIINDGTRGGAYYLIFKNTAEYRNVTHLWCELENSLIPLKPFIEYFQDGILIANEKGVVNAANKAFCQFVNSKENNIVGQTIDELHKQGIIPDGPLSDALRNKKNLNEVIQFPGDQEAIVSTTIVYDKKGEIVRMISRICDITEIKRLHEKLQSATAMAEHYKRQLNAKNSSDWGSQGVFRSRAMEDLYELINKVAETDLPLLFMGESGVGKSALAKHIHSIRKKQFKGDLVHINCSAIPETLLESELFGYEQGAFTGANKVKIGLFEVAQDGMVFLDEIGDMPLSLQGKLLNVLQEKKFYRIGGTRLIETKAKIMAATNQNLEQLVAEGRFRRDLFFRLNVIPLTIPPLRDRKEDIASLVTHVLTESNKKNGRSKVLSQETQRILLAYSWPGNIRELLNVIERIVVLTERDIVHPEDLPAELLGQRNADNKPEQSNTDSSGSIMPLWTPGQPLKHAVSQTEAQIIEQAVRFYGTVKEAAKKLGVDESTLTRKRSRNSGKKAIL